MEIFAFDTGAHFLLEMLCSLGFSDTTLLEFLFPFWWFLLRLAQVCSLFSSDSIIYPIKWVTSLIPGLLGIPTLSDTQHMHLSDVGGCVPFLSASS